MWQVLVANLAVVSLFVSSWNHAQHWLNGCPERLRVIAFAGFMGAGTLASMLLSVQLREGVFVDLRSSLISISAFFGGPLGAVVVGGMAAAFRATVGGSGVWAGLGVIALTAFIGLAGRRGLKGREPTLRQLAVLSAAIAATAMVTIALIEVTSTQPARPWLVVSVAALNFAATLMAGFVIRQGRKWAMESDLLKAAFRGSPDFQYIKDEQSRFVAVNQTVATYNGFPDPEQMRGKSDLDIAPADRAEALMAMERHLLSTGEGIRDFEEMVEDPVGGARWFATSKSPIRNAEGAIIGLAGVTRDVTAYKKLQKELNAKSDQFLYALREMSDGLVMFDQDGVLVLCNDRYRDFFPLTASVRQPGVHIRSILAAVVQTREQVGIPGTGAETWIDEVVDSLKVRGEQEVRLFDGRWMSIRTRPTREGMAMVVVSDITRIKQAEVTAVGVRDRLKALASTDSLTGVLNRRAFDQTLEAELARGARARTPVSLLMIDVDHFKAYNDTYGHPAGDECLRAVSRCLKKFTRRGGDTVARYGGEEFAVVMAQTNEASAQIAAEKLRMSVRKLELPHKGSNKGLVTISVGVATAVPGDRDVRPTELITRADRALYEAKQAGRDRVSYWSTGDSQDRPVQAARDGS